MNQTRVFLLFAWLMVATLLWMEWSRERAAPPVAEAAVATVEPGVPTAPVAAGDGSVPSAPVLAPTVPGTPPPAAADAAVTVETDVLRVVLDGGEVRRAHLTGYPDVADLARPVELFTDEARRYFVAQSGWISSTNPAPTHQAGFVPAGPARTFALAEGADRVDVPFVWRGPDGVTIQRTYTFQRGRYAVLVSDRVLNASAQPWQGFVYRQLARVPRELDRSGPMSAEQYSFQGAAWFSPADGYERRDYDDYADEEPLAKPVTGGWIAMLQHHFFAAWIPQAGDDVSFQTTTLKGPAGTTFAIREVGPAVSVAPGQQAETSARLWVGPKLVDQIQAQNVPGLERAVDFSRFTIFATIAGWLFAVLSWLYGLLGNWGWSIVGLVVLIKLLLLPVANAQYKSMARMRKLQPKLQQLKERYGEDRQKFQMAMMELYRKEKVNPLGGCLPILVQMPIFLALYWMLSESVELRHADWILWIEDLTARDPYFVLPAINLVVMWVTQKLQPMVGMDPMQQKMMQFMPIVFGIMFAFFPAGLVLYWVTNGLLSLLQQMWMLRRYGDRPTAKA